MVLAARSLRHTHMRALLLTRFETISPVKQGIGACDAGLCLAVNQGFYHVWSSIFLVLIHGRIADNVMCDKSESCWLDDLLIYREESRLLSIGSCVGKFYRGHELKKMHDFLCQGLLKSSNALPGRVGVNTCLVLQYHRVASLCFDPLQLAVEPYIFERQIEYLAENFNVISIDELKIHLETSRPFRERTVVITFDGGYCDILYTAKDVLDRFGVPAAVFASSANIIEGGRFWWQELEDFLLANNCRGQLELEIDCQLCRWPLLTQFDKCRAYEDLYSILSNKTPSEQRIIVEEISGSLELHAEEFDNHRTMSGQELRKLTEGGLITVGGHTHNYVKLSSLPAHRRIAEGKSTKLIARELYVSPKTVEWHRSQLMKKLSIDSVAELVKYAISEGLTSIACA